MKTPVWLEWLCNIAERYEKALYFGLLVLLLWPVWTNAYFLTLDGPCHLYNASVLLDFWRGTNTDFFSKFYEVNPHVDPNWFSHIALAVLMQFLSPQLSEKVFITSYILCFLLFSRWLILYINSANSFLVFIPFLFVYNHVFQMGFYNFSFSLACMALIWLLFLKFMHRWHFYLFVPVAALVLLVTYLMHPVGYLLSCGTLVLILFLEAVKNADSFNTFLTRLLQHLKIAVPAMLPSFALLAYFFFRRSSIPAFPTTDTFDFLVETFVHLSSIINLVATEAPFALAVFILMIVTLVAGIIYKIRRSQLSQYDGFLVVTLSLVVFYFVSPGGIAGGGLMADRLQIMPFVVFPFWLASVPFPKWITVTIGTAAIILTVCLMAVRIPAHKLCSEAVEEYVSAEKYIDDKSTVIPLSYEHGGITPDGKTITTATWIFFHAGDYIGTKKPLIMMGNYEGDTGYFPLLWKHESSPFVHLTDGDGIEGRPPQINIPNYEKETVYKVEYVLLLCYSEQYANHPNTKNLFESLDANYKLVFTSEHGRAVLYRRNK